MLDQFLPMFLLRLITIASLAIVLLIIFFSNLTPAIPLVFLGKSTVPISLGTLVLGAIGIGLATSLVLRLLIFWQRPPQRRPKPAAEFSYEPAPDQYESSSRQQQEPEYDDEPPQRSANRRPAVPASSQPEFKYEPPNDSVYDANYRVINQPTPRDIKPEVGSKLPSDSDDWGFDFEDEDEDKPRK
jgi:cell division protein FtsN